MSDKSVLDEFLNKKPSGASATVLPLQRQPHGEPTEKSDADENEIVERRAFGVGRGRRQPFMLDVRMMDKQRLALSYSHLTKAAFDPSGVIVLEFSSQIVRIEGRNLQPVYENLVLQNVIYVQEENADLEQQIAGEETFISNIGIGNMSDAE